MKKKLATLYNYLEYYRPNLILNLKPPLMNDEINSIENKYKLSLPKDIKQLYRWKNGQELSAEEAFVNGYYFFPLEEMIRLYKDEMYGFKTSQFPLFGDIGGSYRSFVCFDDEGLYNGRRGEIFCYNNSEPFDEDIAADLEEFIDKMNDFYSQAKLKKTGNDYYISFNGRKRSK